MLLSRMPAIYFFYMAKNESTMVIDQGALLIYN